MVSQYLGFYKNCFLNMISCNVPQEAPYWPSCRTASPSKKGEDLLSENYSLKNVNQSSLSAGPQLRQEDVSWF